MGSWQTRMKEKCPTKIRLFHSANHYHRLALRGYLWLVKPKIPAILQKVMHGTVYDKSD